MMKNILFCAVISWFCGFTFAGEATEVPPIPKGYADDQAVKMAILLGQIKLIDAMNISIPDNVEEIPNIEYGTGGERKLHLDMYLPKGRTKATPAIIFIHGGAWSGGKRSDMKFYCIKFTEKGYVTATVTYRLTGEAPFRPQSMMSNVLFGGCGPMPPNTRWIQNVSPYPVIPPVVIYP
jgi:hypothetical protein